MTFGRKFRRSLGGFGKKFNSQNIQDFGKKLSTIERKTVNTIDEVAPIASLLATVAGRPDIAEAITTGNDNLQQTHRDVRQVLGNLESASSIATRRQGGGGQSVGFGYSGANRQRPNPNNPLNQ